MGVGAGEGASASSPFYMFTHALHYAQSWGRPVFPLVRGEKRPATPNGFKDASLSHIQLSQWWVNEDPNYGIGLPTGDGLVVVDVDVDSGGEIPSWCMDNPTLTVATRSGGWHLYFKVNDPVPSSVGKVAPHVDIRGEGGYVVAPPTPGWRWANDLPIRALEAWHMLGIRQTGSQGRSERFSQAAEGSLREGDGRNDYLLSYLGWAREQGITDEDQLLQLGQLENERACAEPLDDGEVQAIWRSSLRYLNG